jgi:predicted ester cyclase
MLKVWLCTVLALTAIRAESAGDAAKLIEPKEVIADHSLSKSALDSMTLAPLTYDSFWNSGDERLARSALSASFVDHTLPPERAQGPSGPIAASKTFRTAVPDLTCEVGQMMVAGDRVTAFLHFRGHYTGEFNGRKGQGQRVDFIAIDIYRVINGVITEDWHLEDNLTLLKQLGTLN